MRGRDPGSRLDLAPPYIRSSSRDRPIRTTKMRLINVHTFRLENFYQDPTEPYAILSHTWGKEEDELSFQDMLILQDMMLVLDNPNGQGREKLRNCCQQARKDGIKYVWIDTCCIDKTNSVELGEAINSMFRWYQKSSICYTYLSDVDIELSKAYSRDRIPDSRWFTRGWTLQELLASRKMTFFDASWTALGTKSSLAGLIGQATGIPHHILTGISSLHTCSVAQRLSWASKRTTTRPEDMAYCLLGIFDVMIPLLYGEGLEAAFERLQEAILRKTRDDSILAWSLGTIKDNQKSQEHNPFKFISGGVLAASPAAFEECGDIVKHSQTETQIQAFEIFGGTMPVSISLSSDLSFHPIRYGYLSCGPKSDPSLVVSIPLVDCSAGKGVGSAHAQPVFLRPRGLNAICMRRPEEDIGPPRTISIRKDRTADGIQPEDRSNWFYLPGPYPYNATLDEVYPAECFESEMAMIKTPKDLQDNGHTTILTRFSYSIPQRNDESVLGRFILGLELFHGSSTERTEPRAYLCFEDKRQTALSEVAKFWETLVPSLTTQLVLDKPLLALAVSVCKETIAGSCVCVVNLLDAPPDQCIPHHALHWARVSHLISLRKDTRSLVQFLYEGAELSQKRDKYDNVLRLSEAKVDVTNGKLREVTSQLASLKAEAERLQYQLDRQTGYRVMLQDLSEGVNVELDLVAGKIAEIEARPTFLRWILAGGSEERREGGTEEQMEVFRKRHRDGLIAYLMSEDPIKIKGKEMAWATGITLLMYAAASGNAAFVKAVVAYDSDLEARDEAGRTALDWAVLTGSKESIALFQDWTDNGIPPEHMMIPGTKSLKKEDAQGTKATVADKSYKVGPTPSTTHQDHLLRRSAGGLGGLPPLRRIDSPSSQVPGPQPSTGFARPLQPARNADATPSILVPPGQIPRPPGQDDVQPADEEWCLSIKKSKKGKKKSKIATFDFEPASGSQNPAVEEAPLIEPKPLTDRSIGILTEEPALEPTIEAKDVQAEVDEWEMAAAMSKKKKKGKKAAFDSEHASGSQTPAVEEAPLIEPEPSTDRSIGILPEEPALEPTTEAKNVQAEVDDWALPTKKSKKGKKRGKTVIFDSEPASGSQTPLFPTTCSSLTSQTQ